jgi:uncharacterized C2H2 Zn-finger protein
MKIKCLKCLVCGKEFNNQEDFEFHILLPEIEKRERERKRKCRGWGYGLWDIEEKHRKAFKESVEEGFKTIEQYGYKGKCKLCGADLEVDWWTSEWSDCGWIIKCPSCGILFDED